MDGVLLFLSVLDCVECGVPFNGLSISLHSAGMVPFDFPQHLINKHNRSVLRQYAKERKQLVVVGGGFAGAIIAKKLERKFK